MAKGYVDRNLHRRAVAAAKRIITALSTNMYCGASGMPCDRAGTDCCVSGIADEDLPHGFRSRLTLDTSA